MSDDAILVKDARREIVGVRVPTKVDKGTVVVNVRDYGAVGDGVTLDHVAINAAIVAGAGKTVLVPVGPLGASVYLITATAGIKMWTAGVRLLLDPGVTIKAAPNNAAGYSMIEVNAADCVIEGGTIEGDGTAHTGVTGEHGHCITTAAGANRLRIQSVKVTKAWGDGIALQGGPSDVSVIDVTADDNRRQGMSIIEAIRPRVIGGVYKNTGLSQRTAPTAGIDVEPNSTTTVTDCVITGVTFSGNYGPGLQIATATGSLAEVTVTGCRSVGSTTGWGFYIIGPTDTIKAKLTGCHALSNALHGYTVVANKVELTGCTARQNTQYGFLIQDDDCTMIDPVAVENGRHGISISASTVDNTVVIGGITRANSQTTSGAYVNVDHWGTGTRIVGHTSDAGTLANKPAWGYLFRAGSTARVIGSDTRGTFTGGAFSDGSGAGNTLQFPKIGATIAAAIAAPTAPSAAYVQAEAASAKTAIDAIRAALTAYGITL